MIIFAHGKQVGGCVGGFFWCFVGWLCGGWFFGLLLLLLKSPYNFASKSLSVISEESLKVMEERDLT